MRRVLLASLLVILPARALADDDREARAKALAQRGLEQYEHKDYAAAITSFEEAYALKNAPRLLFNIAQAHRLSGACALARKYYADYLQADPGSEIAREVKRRIRQMDACVERQDRRQEPAPPAPTPAPAPASAPAPAPPPGPPPLPVAPPAPVEPEGGGGGMRLAGILTGCGGVLVLGTGAWFGVRSRHAAEQVDAKFHEGGDWTQADRTLEARGQRDQTVAIVLGVAGTAALAGGVFLYLWGSREDLAVAVLPGGAGLTWSASF